MLAALHPHRLGLPHFIHLLAPVGVLLAVLGYAVGTYGAWFCGMLMQVISH